MLSGGNGFRLGLKAFSGLPAGSFSAKENPIFEEEKRAELRDRTGFEKTPLQRLFSEIFSPSTLKKGTAMGSLGLFACGSSLGANPDAGGSVEEDVDDTTPLPDAGADSRVDNPPPNLRPIPDQEVDEGELLEFEVSYYDPDGEPLEVTAKSLPTGAVFNEGVFSWTPNFDQAGEYEATFAVMYEGEVINETVHITVNNVNRPPVLDSIENQTVEEGQALVFSVSASDPDEDSIEITAEDLPDGADFDGTDFSWTPNFDQEGSYEVRFNASDGDLQSSQTVNIMVTHGNRPPLLEPIPDQIVGEAEELTFGVSTSDPDGDAVDVTAEGLPAGASFDGEFFRWMPTYDQAGEYSVLFRAGDGELNAEQTARIIVNHVNRPPLLESIPAQVVNEEEALTFAVTASDPDRDELSVTAMALPAGALFDGTFFRWTPNYDQAGNYLVSFRASDGLLIDEQTAEIAVNNVNRPPVLSPIADQVVVEGEELRIEVSASDPDDDEVVIRAEGLPEGAAFDGETFVWRPGFEQAGDYEVTFEASDGNLMAVQRARITVGQGNRPPVLEVVEDQTVDEEGILEFVLRALDPDGDPVVYSVRLASGDPLPEGASLNAGTGVFLWTPDCLRSGVYRMIFTATDSREPPLSASQEADIEVVDRCVEVEWTRTHSGEANSDDIGFGVAVDVSENVYVTGEEQVTGQAKNIWVQKYDLAGNEIFTATHNGPGNSLDGGRGIAVDPSENIYVAGYESLAPGIRNFWIRRYDSVGNGVWTVSDNGLGAWQWGQGYGIAVDMSVNVYVTGEKISNENGWDTWIGKYGTDGGEVWNETYDRFGDSDWGNGITIDGRDVVVVGSESDSNSRPDCTIHKMDVNGDSFWTRWFDSPLTDFPLNYGNDVVTDSSGNVFAIGQYVDTWENGYLWVRKLDSNGNPIWAWMDDNYINSITSRQGIDVDSHGNIYTCGGGLDFRNGRFQYASKVQKMDTNGNIIWTLSENDKSCNDIALGVSGNIYVTGADHTTPSNADIWVRKYRNAP